MYNIRLISQAIGEVYGETSPLVCTPKWWLATSFYSTVNRTDTIFYPLLNCVSRNKNFKMKKLIISHKSQQQNIDYMPTWWSDPLLALLWFGLKSWIFLLVFYSYVWMGVFEGERRGGKRRKWLIILNYLIWL